jgi:uncharacterized membrane protein
MVSARNFAMTRQGVRDLDRPVEIERQKINVGTNERTISTLGGAVLAGLGLSRGGLWGLGLAALGGALIHRGTSGHCLVYEASGVNTAR